MKVEIKKLKFGLIGREGIRTFECQLYIDGVNTAVVNEDGNGGCLRIHFFNHECRKLNEAADKWLKENHKQGEFVSDLETKIIDLVSDVETQKQLAKDQKKGICWQKPGQGKETYTITKWNGKSLEDMLANPGGMMAVREVVMKLYKDKCKVLNTNLPESWLVQLGTNA